MTLELLRAQINPPIKTEVINILPEDCSLFERIENEKKWQILGGYPLDFYGWGKQLFLDCLEASKKTLPEYLFPKPNEDSLSYSDRLFNILVKLAEQRIERMKLDNFSQEEKEQEFERRRLVGIILCMKISKNPLGIQN